MPLDKDEEVMERLNRIARMIGRVFGIGLGVDQSGDRLIFVDENSDSIMKDGDEIIAATKEEIDTEGFFDSFPSRAFGAGFMAKYQQIERSRTP